ncbi:uncharacterized protein LOC121390412 [Gigantopelta aegis]|uniref:uncharacterized protein LOC121390412 n=1 Tax=Gigantopelta aegis TaxID=1735272 RepID=UPI001B88B0C0|nr:uncharacterized protein LOC121390412 [Gigantopelta aegis]
MQGPLTDQNWQDRREIVMALINSSPQSIPIQLRTPEAKMKICNTTTPATLSDVHQNTCVGRAGQHNDCFLGDDTDVGTYTDVTTEKAYLAQDTLHLPMSGETCQRSVDANGQETSRSGCETALRELFGFHWTLLHDNYNLDVLNDWKSERCFYIIHQNLGYRLYLKNVILPTSVEAGGEVCYHIVLSNIVSAPYKPWKVALVFKSQTGSQYYAVDLDNVDVRSWLPGPDIVLSGTTKLPSDATSGTYDMFLAIYDEKTKQLSNYCILLANTGVPQYTAGLNSLQTTIQVSGVNSETSSCTSATTWTPPTPGTYSRVFIPPT